MFDFCATSNIFQSTLPRRERLKKIATYIKNDTISIHAPAKGATKKRDNGVDHRSISIHAPAKGATSVRYLPHASQTDFNPRSREGSDAHG